MELGSRTKHEVARLEGEDLWNPQEMGTRSQERLPKVFCCNDWEETGGLGLGEQKEKRRSVTNLSIFLAGVACSLAECLLKLEAWMQGKIGGDELKGRWSVIVTRARDWGGKATASVLQWH